MNNLQTAFNNAAEDYDQLRQKLIPQLDLYHEVVVEQSQLLNNDGLVMDLGAGTGLLTSKIAKKYPDATFDLVDVAINMLEIAKTRPELQKNCFFYERDFRRLDLKPDYDLIISSLAIHHLTVEEKVNLFQTIYNGLKPGGRFINADQVCGATDAIDATYKAHWKNFVEGNNLTHTEKNATYERTKLDKMDTLENQLEWLKNIGFNDVTSYYQHYSFVVYSGRKSDHNNL